MLMRHLKNACVASKLVIAVARRQCASLSHAPAVAKISLKTKICNSMEGKYEFHYDNSTDILLQFDSNPTLTLGVRCDDRELPIDVVWLNTPSKTNDEAIQKFIHLTEYLLSDASSSITSTEFDRFIDQFTESMSQFNENEMLAALQIFSRMPIKQLRFSTRNFRELFMALDDNSARCAMDWDTDKRLAVCAIWNTIPSARKSKFIMMVCNQFVRNFNGMSVKHFVSAVVYMNLMYHSIEDLNAFQNDFLALIDDMTLNEILLVSCAFNRKNFRITNTKLIDGIMRRLVEDDLDDVKDGALHQLVKVSDQRTSCKSGQRIFETLFYHCRSSEHHIEHITTTNSCN